MNESVRENARGYLLKVELPQVTQKDAKIVIEDHIIYVNQRRIIRRILFESGRGPQCRQ
jgi:hypothetical protein